MCGLICGSKRRETPAVGLVLVAMLVGCGDERSLPQTTKPSNPPPAPSESASSIVVWSLMVAPQNVSAGGAAVVELRASIAAGWSIHPLGAAHGPSLPTKLELTLPVGVEATADWDSPPASAPIDRPDAGSVYEGDVTFRRELKIADDAAANTAEIRCTVEFQACDATLCRRPEQRTLVTKLRVTD
jgi:hypothetical protein